MRCQASVKNVADALARARYLHAKKKGKKVFAHPPIKVRAHGRCSHALNCSLLSRLLPASSHSCRAFALLAAICFPRPSTTDLFGMAPKKDRAPPSTFLSPTKMSPAMLEDMEKRGVISPGYGWVSPKTDVHAKPYGDMVFIFRDFFSRLGSAFPLILLSSRSSLGMVASSTR